MKNIELNNKTILLTGAAGFIGSNLAKRLLNEVNNVKVIGLDNMNDYYDVNIKDYRLTELSKFNNFMFIRGNLSDKELINKRERGEALSRTEMAFLDDNQKRVEEDIKMLEELEMEKKRMLIKLTLKDYIFARHDIGKGAMNRTELADYRKQSN